MKNNLTPINHEEIISKIYYIRGQKVMLDKDLAELYSVETKALNQAVKRNLSRFPSDFMFQLSKDEDNSLRSQNVTLKRGEHRKYLSYVFTEHGILMLSNTLKSERAINVSIQIIRIFVKLREILTSHKELRDKIERMEKQYDQQFQVIFEAIKHIMLPPEKPKKIGFLSEK